MTGPELKDFITDSGVEQAEIARRLGITPQALQKKFKVKEVKGSFLESVEGVIKVITNNDYSHDDPPPHVNEHETTYRTMTESKYIALLETTMKERLEDKERLIQLSLKMAEREREVTDKMYASLGKIGEGIEALNNKYQMQYELSKETSDYVSVIVDFVSSSRQKESDNASHDQRKKGVHKGN